MTRHAIEHEPLTELEVDGVLDVFMRRIVNKYRSTKRVPVKFWCDLCVHLIEQTVVRGRWRGREAMDNAEIYFVQECRRRGT